MNILVPAHRLSAYWEAVLQPAQRLAMIMLAVIGLALMAANPAFAQDIEAFDPDDAYSDPSTATEVDLAEREARARERLQTGAQQASAQPVPVPAQAGATPEVVSGTAFFPDDPQAQTPVQTETGEETQAWVDPASGATVAQAEPSDEAGQVAVNEAATYAEDDLIGAAEGVFGKGAEGLAKVIQDLLKKEGQPNGYIVGREAGGAFVVGARYGSGTLHHKVEGDQKVYWTGPSIGFDAGANAGNTFVLVYNLFDTEDLFERYPAGEGQAYFVGGLNVSYVRRGDVVLIPIRVGAGLRLGVNAGYMRFSKKQRWVPF